MTNEKCGSTAEKMTHFEMVIISTFYELIFLTHRNIEVLDFPWMRDIFPIDGYDLPRKLTICVSVVKALPPRKTLLKAFCVVTRLESN